MNPSASVLNFLLLILLVVCVLRGWFLLRGKVRPQWPTAITVLAVGALDGIKLAAALSAGDKYWMGFAALTLFFLALGVMEVVQLVKQKRRE